jgi:hypothetical protein
LLRIKKVSPACRQAGVRTRYSPQLDSHWKL